MYSNKKILLVLCVTLNFVNLNSGNSKKGYVKNYGPNFEPEYPQFTPFNSQEFINMSDDLNVEDEFEQVPTSQHAVFVKAPLPTQQSYPQQIFNGAYRPKDTHLTERLKPLTSLMMGLYNNYRSTYTGNQTFDSSNPTLLPEQLNEVENKIEEIKVKKNRRKLKKKQTHFGQERKYNVGPGVNVSLNTNKELVNVYLDEDCLKDVFTGFVASGSFNDLVLIFFLFFSSRTKTRSNFKNITVIYFAIFNTIGNCSFCCDNT